MCYGSMLSCYAKLLLTLFCTIRALQSGDNVRQQLSRLMARYQLALTSTGTLLDYAMPCLLCDAHAHTHVVLQCDAVRPVNGRSVRVAKPTRLLRHVQY